MTEKRFKIKYINEQHLSANLYDNKIFIGSIGIGAELIVELLNNLSEENEKLKKEKEYYKRELQKDLVCQATIDGRKKMTEKMIIFR